MPISARSAQCTARNVRYYIREKISHLILVIFCVFRCCLLMQTGINMNIETQQGTEQKKIVVTQLLLVNQKIVSRLFVTNFLIVVVVSSSNETIAKNCGGI